MKFEAIIFDMDGTIINTEHIWKKANLTLLQRRSISLSKGDINRIQKHMHGLSVSECCLYMKLEFKLDNTVEDLVYEKNIVANALFKKEVNFIEGFTNFFEQVRTHNLKSAIATNANDTTIAITDKALNLRHYFGNHIYGISSVLQGKPDPALFIHAAEKLQINPKNCIVIEDSKHGITAAKKAGMYCIGINTAKNSENLKEADSAIDHYNQLNLQDILKKTI